MADYVAGGGAPDGDELTALGEFLYEREFGIPASLVYVVSAFHQPPGTPPPAVALLWSDDSIRIGDAAVTAELAGKCARFTGEDGEPAMLDGFTMAADEVLVVAEVCARLSREGSITGRFVAGDIYRLHATPARDPGQPPAEPIYSWLAPRGGAAIPFPSPAAGGFAGCGRSEPATTPCPATGAAA